MSESYDVVVVGFGLAGAVAAITALRGGARTLVIDAAPAELAGGNSLVSGQGIMSAENVGEFMNYLGAIGVTPSRARALAEAVPEVPSFLTGLGIPLRSTTRGADFPREPGAPSLRGWKVEGTEPLVRVAQRQAMLLGAEVHVCARASRGRVDELGRIEIGYSIGGWHRQVVAKHAAVLACGGTAASERQRYRASFGSTFARGDGRRIAHMLGASLAGSTVSGPYYGFVPPGSRTAVTPWPLYELELPSSQGQLIAQRSGSPLSAPESKLHGLMRRPDGRLSRQELPDAVLIFPEPVLNSGPLVRAWPDGHSRGWGRREGASPWSKSNERELRAGWIFEAPRGLIRAIGAPTRQRHFGVHVRASLLNTLGGLACDDIYRVLGDRGPLGKLYSAGELASVFRGMYQGSANLTECVVSARSAVAAALGGGRK